MRRALRDTVLPLAMLAGLTLLTFGEVRNYFFTDVDTFSLINDGRSRTLSDVILHFDSELMAGRMINAVFYRPLTSVTLGTEYALFGLNPRGYHLVSLAVLWVTAFLLVKIAQTIWRSGRGTAIGGLAAALFILHPVQIDAAPAIARLGDLLFTLFTLLGLLCALDGMTARGGRLRRRVVGGVSVVCVSLAFLAKEPGILAPLVLGLSVLVFSAEAGLARRIRRSLTLIAPHCAAVAILLGWRWHVLHGLGGYADDNGRMFHIKLSSLTVKMTILGHLVSPFFTGLTDSFDRYGAMFLVEHKALIYPLFVVSMVALFAAVWRSGLRVARLPYRGEEATARTDERAAWTFGGQAFLYFVFSMFAGFETRYLYFSLTAFAMLLALAVVTSAERVARRQVAYGRLVAVAVVLALVYWHSPAWSKERLRRWQMSSEVARTILTDLDAIAKRSDAREIFVLNLPYAIRFGESTFVAAVPANQLLLDHSLLDYLDLRKAGPNWHGPKVIVLSYLLMTGPPEEMVAHSEFVSPTRLRVTVEHGGVPGEYPWQEIAGRRSFKAFFRSRGGARRQEGRPPGGWPNVMTIQLLPPAFQEPRRAFYVYDGHGLREVTPIDGSQAAADRSATSSR